MTGRGARRSRERKARLGDSGRGRAIHPRPAPLSSGRYSVSCGSSVSDTLPGASEDLKWGQPCYLVGREKVVYLHAAGDQVNLGFFRAAELEDPKGLLEGTGEGMRHVNVRVPSDVKRREFAALLRQAARGAIIAAMTDDRPHLRVSAASAAEELPARDRKRRG